MGVHVHAPQVFVAGFRETLAALTTEEFQESVDALVAIKLEPPKTYLQVMLRSMRPMKLGSSNEQTSFMSEAALTSLTKHPG